jgi:hypothetical protein
MSLFQYLALQEVEPDNPDSELDLFERDDEMTLDDTIDGEALDRRWTAIVEGIDSDSERKSFHDDE